MTRDEAMKLTNTELMERLFNAATYLPDGSQSLVDFELSGQLGAAIEILLREAARRLEALEAECADSSRPRGSPEAPDGMRMG
jgi:hypothetical protein